MVFIVTLTQSHAVVQVKIPNINIYSMQDGFCIDHSSHPLRKSACMVEELTLLECEVYMQLL